MTSEHRGATRMRNLGTPTFSKRLEQRLLRALEGTMAERTTREWERVAWIDRGRQRASGSLDASTPAPSSPRSTPAPGTRRLPADVQEQHNRLEEDLALDAHWAQQPPPPDEQP